MRAAAPERGDDTPALAAPRQGRGGARRHPRGARRARRARRIRRRRPLDAAPGDRRLPGRAPRPSGGRVRPRLARDADGPGHQAEGHAPLLRPGVRHRGVARPRPPGVRHAVRREDAARERGDGDAVRRALPQRVDLRRRADRPVPAAAGRARRARPSRSPVRAGRCRPGTTGRVRSCAGTTSPARWSISGTFGASGSRTVHAHGTERRPSSSSRCRRGSDVAARRPAWRRSTR